MKFFLDTANLEQIREMQALGIIDGVTTNPTLLSKEGREPKEQLKKICKIVEGPISAEVIGLKAVKILENEGIKTNVTLVFSQNQVLIAAKAGASYISPFIGRLMDNGQNEIDMLRESMEIIKGGSKDETNNWGWVMITFKPTFFKKKFDEPQG